jgi:hydrogenase nickel incorporation protein HypA/HybF
MHELAIAQSVIEIACRHAAGRRVSRVNLKIGHLRQVVPSALTFSFDVVAEGTPAEGAELAIEAVPAVARCRACGAESEQPAFPFQCSACGGLDLEVIAGNELIVESLEIEEEEGGKPLSSFGTYSH